MVKMMKKQKKIDDDKLLIKKKKFKKPSYGAYLTRDAVNRIYKGMAEAKNKKTKDNDGI